MHKVSSLKKISDQLPETDYLMPVLFIGHGSPMNAIEDNEFSRRWAEIAKKIPTPKAILCISAHWLTRGSFVTAAAELKTIHDFGGFPEELYKISYPAPGMPALAEETRRLVKTSHIEIDHAWGFDHGSWSVARNMYPEANIPMIQLSIDYYQPGNHHYELAKQLSVLRKKGVLILGSGNIVHNLRMMALPKGTNMLNGLNVEYGFDWTYEVSDIIKNHILNQNDRALFDYNKLSRNAHLAIPTPDHYWPLIYTLGAAEKRDEISFFNDKAIAGSLTMTSILIQ